MWTTCFCLEEYEFIYSLIFPKNDIKKKIAGFLLVVANECKLESCPAWLEHYVPSLVSVAKTNPPIFDKRWRYRVPFPRPFMSFFQCLTTINTHMCVEFHDILNMLSASKSPETNFQVDTLPWQQYLDINIPFTVLHRPCFDIILMKFEANRLKIRCWIQSILKMTHFLLPVGGAITLTPNSHIYALGINTTNKTLKFDQNQTMYVGCY